MSNGEIFKKIALKWAVLFSAAAGFPTVLEAVFHPPLTRTPDVLAELGKDTSEDVFGGADLSQVVVDISKMGVQLVLDRCEE